MENAVTTAVNCSINKCAGTTLTRDIVLETIAGLFILQKLDREIRQECQHICHRKTAIETGRRTYIIVKIIISPKTLTVMYMEATETIQTIFRIPK